MSHDTTLTREQLLRRAIAGDDVVRLDDGTSIHVPPAALAGRTGRVSVGVRPEKLRMGGDGVNTLSGRIDERAYIGVSTQYVVETPHGSVTVYIQNTEPGAQAASPGDNVNLSFSPDVAFVVDPNEEAEQ